LFRPEQFAGYDRSTILFSPDGRIIQVEYARKAMQRGTISIGVIASNGIVLLGRRKMDDLILPNRKIFQIDEHIGSVFSGYSADGRYLVSYARERSQVYRFIYNEPVDIEYLGQDIASLMHTYTQFGGARPFGCGLIIGGVDLTGPKLIYVDPGGAMMRWVAGAIGYNKERAERYLRDALKETDWNKTDIKDAIVMGLTALILASPQDLKPVEIELGYIKSGERFVIKTADLEEIKPLYEEAKSKASEWVKKIGEESVEEGSEEEGMI